MNIFYGHNKCEQDKKIACLKSYTQWLLCISERVKDVLMERNLMTEQEGYEKMPSIIGRALNNMNQNPTPNPNQKTEKPLTIIPQFNSSQNELIYNEPNTVYTPVKIIKDNNLISQNIIKGVTIYGVTGTKECNGGGGGNTCPDISTLTIPLNLMHYKTFNAPPGIVFNKVLLDASYYENTTVQAGSKLNGIYMNCTVPTGSNPLNLQTLDIYNNTFQDSDIVNSPSGTAYNKVVNHIPKYINQQVTSGSTLNGLYINCTVPSNGGGGTQPQINIIPYNKTVTSKSQLPNNEQAPSDSAYSPITVSIPDTHDIYNKSQVLTIGSLQNTSAVEPHVLEGFTFYMKNHANQLKFKTGSIPNCGNVEQQAPFEANNCYFQHIRITGSGGGGSGNENPISKSRFNLLATDGSNIGNEILVVSKEQFIANSSFLYAGFTISVQGGTYFFRTQGFSIGLNKTIFSSYSNNIVYPSNSDAFKLDNNPQASLTSSKTGLIQSLWWMSNFGRLNPPEGEYAVFNSVPYKAIQSGYNLLSAYEWKALNTYFIEGNQENIWDYLENIQDSRIGLSWNNGRIWTTTPVMHGGQLKVWSASIAGKNGVSLHIENMNTQLLGVDATKYVSISLYDGL